MPPSGGRSAMQEGEKKSDHCNLSGSSVRIYSVHYKNNKLKCVSMCLFLWKITLKLNFCLLPHTVLSFYIHKQFHYCTFVWHIGEWHIEIDGHSSVYTCVWLQNSIITFLRLPFPDRRLTTKGCVEGSIRCLSVTLIHKNVSLSASLQSTPMCYGILK